ncbi:MAG: PDZ domain-containing protein, partial [Gemmataceae bacterium]
AYGYDYTVTRGIVSAVKRDVSLNREISYKNLIQTDASINPGNSGGPLLNIHGELVGVNVAIRAGAQGISFAIPVETMIKAAAQMFRTRNHLWHGIVARDLAGCGDDFCVKRQLLVDTLESGSPAARAGLQAGDVIVKVGKCPTLCTLDLERSLYGRASGDLVPVVLRRGGAEKTVDLVLAASERSAPAPASPPDMIWARLGLRLKLAQVEQVSSVNQQLHGGLTILDVRADSPASKAGMKPGDILIGLHQWETVSPDNVVFVLSHKDLASFQPLSFYLVRAGQIHRGWLQQLD